MAGARKLEEERCERCARWERRMLDWGRCGHDGRTTYGHAPCGNDRFERRAVR